MGANKSKPVGRPQGVYVEVERTFPLSQRGYSKALVFVLRCGHAVVPYHHTNERHSDASRKWCYLCTKARSEAEAKAAEQARLAKATAPKAKAAKVPEGMVLVDRAMLEEFQRRMFESSELDRRLAMVAERAANSVLDKLTTPTPAPHPLEGEGGEQPAPVFTDTEGT